MPQLARLENSHQIQIDHIVWWLQRLLWNWRKERQTHESIDKFTNKAKAKMMLIRHNSTLCQCYRSTNSQHKIILLKAELKCHSLNRAKSISQMNVWFDRLQVADHWSQSPRWFRTVSARITFPIEIHLASWSDHFFNAKRWRLPRFPYTWFHDLEICTLGSFGRS